MLGELLRDERQPGRKFKDATAHEIAEIIIGQLARITTLLGRQHAQHTPIADTRAYTANTPVQIYTAGRKQIIRIVAISAGGAGNVLLSTVHPTTGPNKWPVFALQATAAGPLPFSEHEFELPRDGQLWAQIDQSVSLSITASVFDGEEAALIMNYEF